MNLKWNHLANVCMTYNQHLYFSLLISFKLFWGSVRAFMHAIFPPIFSKSTTLLLQNMQNIIANSGCKNEIENQ